MLAITGTPKKHMRAALQPRSPLLERRADSWLAERRGGLVFGDCSCVRVGVYLCPTPTRIFSTSPWFFYEHPVFLQPLPSFFSNPPFPVFIQLFVIMCRDVSSFSPRFRRIKIRYIGGKIRMIVLIFSSIFAFFSNPCVFSPTSPIFLQLFLSPAVRSAFFTPHTRTPFRAVQ